MSTGPGGATAAAIAAAGAEVERILAGEGAGAGILDADDLLRAAVRALVDGVPGWEWVGISFTDEGSLLLGPWAGVERSPGEPPPVRVPIRFGTDTVAELGIAPGPAPAPGSDVAAALDRLASLLAAHCLVGWDTGGVAWDDL